MFWVKSILNANSYLKKTVGYVAKYLCQGMPQFSTYRGYCVYRILLFRTSQSDWWKELITPKDILTCKLVACRRKNATCLLSLHVLLESADEGHFHVQALWRCLSAWCLNIFHTKSVLPWRIPCELCGCAYRSETLTPNKRRWWWWWGVNVPVEVSILICSH